ncbi:MAG TPA: glycosyltransferase [Gemmatimonadaceae bacterium]
MDQTSARPARRYPPTHAPEVPSQLTNIASVSLVALLLIWLGYPAVIWLLALLFGRSVRSLAATGDRRVSVIVASRDDASMIRERARDALSAHYTGGVEVVVARDAAGPDSASFSLDDLGGNARVVRGDDPGGKACALNAAVRSASGDILVFSDTAQRFAPNAIALLVAALEDGRLGAVSGALRLRTEPSAKRAGSLTEWYWRFERWLRGEEARIHSTVGVTGAIYAMRRADWRPLPAGVLCDDLYIPMELVLRGYRVGFSREAQAIDERRFEASQEYQRKVRTLTGVLQVCIWLPAVLVPLRNPIWLQFVSHKLLRLLTPYLVLVMLVTAAGAGAAALGKRPNLAFGAPLLLAFALGVLLLIWVASRRARAAVVLGLAMQLAVVRATWNGLRGDWDVWRR